MTALEGRLCALIAADAAQDPIGSASTISRLLTIETPTPWGERFYDADANGTIQQRIVAANRAYYEALREAGTAEHAFANGWAGVQGIAPDREWSDPARRRALVFTRPDGPMSEFEICEYDFPRESLRVLDLVEAYYAGSAEFEGFEEYRVPHGGTRELFVCTHGQVDICCAMLGVPLYQRAREAYPKVRAWRTTHFGGHRYAPTAWEFPSGYMWGFLAEQATEAVLHRSGTTASVLPHVRGWSGVPSHVQLLDRVGLDQYGWDWLRFARAGEVLEGDTEAGRWRVRLQFTSPAGDTGTYEGTVVVGREIEARGCGPNWENEDHQHRAPEYRLESFTKA